MQNSLFTTLTEFKQVGELRNLARENSDELFEFLLNSPKSAEFKKLFFKHNAATDTLIFLQADFLRFLDSRILELGYTSYSNKIGLTAGGDYLCKNNAVVLDFAFKECVLKGGASKDEQKSNELFFNNILAHKEIDVLTAPKVLTNFELIGEGDLKESLKNTPNLLIKGNNYAALCTLKARFLYYTFNTIYHSGVIASEAVRQAWQSTGQHG